MFCNNCGSMIHDGDRFCQACGARQPEPIQVVQPPVAPAQPVQPVQPIAPPVSTVTEETYSYQPPKKKKFPVVLAVILVVALVIGAVAAVLVLTAKETVYLMTESVSSTLNGMKTTTRYGYDDAGRIVSYEVTMEYPEAYHMDDVELVFEYEYDEDGNLVRAEMEVSGKTAEVEYVYKKGVLADMELESDDGQWEVEIDDEGHIEEILLMDEDGKETGEITFQYYDNGILEKSTLEKESTKTVIEYNEEGKAVETVTYLNGEQIQKTVTEYDDRGNMCSQETSYGEDSSSLMEYILSYDDEDKIVEFTMCLTSSDGDKEETVEIVFELEWDDLECIMTVDEVDGPKDIIDEMPEEFKELEIIYELDENGNLLGYTMEVAGEEYMSVSMEYQEFKLPKNYERIYEANPIYLIFLRNT